MTEPPLHSRLPVMCRHHHPLVVGIICAALLAGVGGRLRQQQLRVSIARGEREASLKFSSRTPSTHAPL